MATPAPWGDPSYEYATVPPDQPDRFPEWERLATPVDGNVLWRRKKVEERADG